MYVHVPVSVHKLFLNSAKRIHFKLLEEKKKDKVALIKQHVMKMYGVVKVELQFYQTLWSSAQHSCFVFRMSQFKILACRPVNMIHSYQKLLSNLDI